MRLAIDIGNTNTKVGWFQGKELSDNRVFEAFPEDELLQLINDKKCERAIISSVKKLSPEFLKAIAQKQVLLFSAQTALPIEIDYATPQTLGVDRIAAAVGVKALFPAENVLCFDFGSCITTEFVDAAGVYKGGSIAPGMQLRFKSMHTFTDKLPLIAPQQFLTPAITGNSTESCMISGVVNGILFEIQGMISTYQLKYANLKVLFTGGDASYFESLLNMKIFADPHLVLKGLNEILEYNAD
ncbi:MAG: type III pantothenate kinase [Bacteroidetes bacterium]|nr:type III pantothenate kinase [Bacteroidota bacterium]